MKAKYILTIRTGHKRRSSESLPEKGSRAGMKNGAGSMPGMAVLAKKPGMTLMDMPELVKIRSRGSRERAWSSDRLLVEAKANKKTVFQVHLVLS